MPYYTKKPPRGFPRLGIEKSTKLDTLGAEFGLCYFV